MSTLFIVKVNRQIAQNLELNFVQFFLLTKEEKCGKMAGREGT